VCRGGRRGWEKGSVRGHSGKGGGQRKKQGGGGKGGQEGCMEWIGEVKAQGEQSKTGTGV